MSLTGLPASPPRPGQMVTWRRCKDLRRLGRAASAVWWQTPSGWAAAGAMWRRLAFSLRVERGLPAAGFRWLGTAASLCLGSKGKGSPPGTEPVLPQLLFLPLLGQTLLKVGWLQTAFSHIPRPAARATGCRPDLVSAHAVTAARGPSSHGCRHHLSLQGQAHAPIADPYWRAHSS